MTTRFIVKAPRKPRFVDAQPRSPAWRAIHLAADRKIPVVKRAFLSALEVFKSEIDELLVARSLATHGPEIAIAAMPWPAFRSSFEGATLSALNDTFAAGARAAARTTKIQKIDFHDLSGLFDLSNPRAVRAAAELTLSLMFLTEPGMRASLGQIIAEGQRSGLSLQSQADQIVALLRDRAGLDPRRTVALQNFERSLREAGVAEPIIAQRVQAQYERLLNNRAAMIARQETMLAASAGQNELWLQAVDEGLIASTTKKRRIITPDDRLCPICDPMKNQTVGLNEPFVSPFNGARVMHGPIHVLCRCTEALVVEEVGRRVAA